MYIWDSTDKVLRAISKVGVPEQAVRLEKIDIFLDCFAPKLQSKSAMPLCCNGCNYAYLVIDGSHVCPFCKQRIHAICGVEVE